MGATPSSRCFNNASPFTFLTTLVSVPPSLSLSLSLSLSSFLYLQILAFSLSVVFLALAICYRRLLLLLLYQYNRGVGHCRHRRQIIWGKRAVLLPLPHSLLSPPSLPSLSLSLSLRHSPSRRMRDSLGDCSMNRFFWLNSKQLVLSERGGWLVCVWWEIDIAM